MTSDESQNASSPANNSSEQADPAPAKKKRTIKKTAKKTTKKAAAKKTAKKTTKKSAAKKTAKKPAKKRAAKKAAAKAEAQADSTDDLIEDAEPTEQGGEQEAQPAIIDETATPEPEPEPDADAQAEPEPDDSDEAKSESKSRSRKKRGTKKTASRKPSSSSSSSSSSRKGDEKKAAKVEMIINYVPGEECRIAMLEDGQLEEFMVEPTDKVSRVGNIYVGRVANIEPAIQAAFVDFGTEENGFLHISDLHPQYFAKGDDKTERVGKKTPRRSRPPIQECLKKGQEIIVQVLKEGVGTKGPTLTSYLSIPGRFLVMMPGMDKVGVSRKEEDDDKRKAAKQILGQLELPDGFGFILRTAGFDRNKTELKRDLAYLARLWKDMEARRKKGNKPRLLYTESDLLVRSIRDLLTSEVERVVIDSEPALKRVGRFIKIAAPRSGAKLSHYNGTRPIFHAFGIESQINAIHAREVMLPSGGRLVIDQTEALVAIDVNSGKSRAARDAETNAFRTNLEAVDSICRQLRLRDMGGLVVCDMIDMRHASHRKQIEQRFNERLKRDRAKSTTAPISPFGLLEMTRQRMRGSMESQHFADCPMCHGRGLVKKPDSVAATAIRDLAALLDHDKVARAELVVNPRVASSLLSTKRTSLTRIELISGKTLDVRVSESLPIDRVAFYAYDANGADIAIEKLKSPKGPNPEPNIVEWRDHSTPDGSWAMDPLDEADETTVQKLAEEIAKKADQAEHVELPVEGELDEDEKIEAPKKKRRRRRRGRGRSGEDQANAESGPESNSEKTGPEKADEEDADDQNAAGDAQGDDERADDEGDQPRKKRRRRRRRGGRGRGTGQDGEASESGEQDDSDEAQDESRDEPVADRDDDNDDAQDEAQGDEAPAKPRRRPRRRPVPPSKSAGKAEDKSEDGAEPQSKPIAEPKPAAKPKKQAPAPKEDKPQPQIAKPVRRGLYSKSRRTLSASELAKLGLE